MKALAAFVDRQNLHITVWRATEMAEVTLWGVKRSCGHARSRLETLVGGGRKRWIGVWQSHTVLVGGAKGGLEEVGDCHSSVPM
jgi:hypothetical protein